MGAAPTAGGAALPFEKDAALPSPISLTERAPLIWRASALSQLHASLPASAGDGGRITMYGRAAGEGEPELAPGCSVPLLTIDPPLRAVAECDDLLLCELWRGARGAHPGCGQLARFTLTAEPEGDCWSGRPPFAASHLGRLLSLLRRRIFDVWRRLDPQLARLSGSFEMFNPAHGANMGWHRDGHAKGEYIAHYYLPQEEMQRSTDGDWPREADSRMRWFEVAMPPLLNDVDDGPVEEELQYAIAFESDEARQSDITRACFVPIVIGSAATQKLVVFEDAKVFHRTPLTAHALSDLQEERRRPIARVVFHGTHVDGSPLLFRVPPAHSHFRKVSACSDSVDESTEDPLQVDQLEVEFPSSLSAALQSYAERQTHSIDHASSSLSLLSEAAALEEALDEYVDGRPSIVQYLMQGGWTARK